MSNEATLAANRLIGRRVLLELWGQGKLEVADELYAPDYIDHVGRGPEPGQVRGPEGIKQAVTLSAPPSGFDLHRPRRNRRRRPSNDPIFRARHAKRPFLGVAPSGRAVTYTGMDLNRIAKGKIVKSSVNFDALALLQQIGLVPPVKGL